MKKLIFVIICLPFSSFNSFTQINPEEDSIKFATPTPIYEVSYARSVAIIDINNDRRNDIVVGVWGALMSDEKRLRIFIQNDQGGIEEEPIFSDTVLFAADMQVIDLNYDGTKELAIANQDTNGIMIFYLDSLNNLKSKSINRGTMGCASVRAADVNNDSLIDFVTARIDYGPPDSFFVYYQQPDGNYKSKSYYLNKSLFANGWVNIQIANVNGDSLTDVVISGGEFGKMISIYLQQKNGELVFNKHLVFNTYLRNIAIADFTGDERNDIAAAEIGEVPCRIGLFVQDSTGNIPHDPIYYTAFEVPIITIPADMDMDGKMDLVVTHTNRYVITIYRQRDMGGFEPYIFIPYANRDAAYQASIAVGDINSDNKPDIVTISPLGDLWLMLNETEKRSTSINQTNFSVPKDYILNQNYPNPFNPTTNISFSIPQNQHMEIKLYDLLGNEIETILNEQKTAGTYTVEFNANNLSSGIYFYRMMAGNFIETRKLIIVK